MDKRYSVLADMEARMGKPVVEALNNGLCVETMRTDNAVQSRAVFIASGVQVLMGIIEHPIFALIAPESAKRGRMVISALLIEGFPELLVPDASGKTPLEYAKAKLDIDCRAAQEAAESAKKAKANDAPRTPE